MIIRVVADIHILSGGGGWTAGIGSACGGDAIVNAFVAATIACRINSTISHGERIQTAIYCSRITLMMTIDVIVGGGGGRGAAVAATAAATSAVTVPVPVTTINFADGDSAKAAIFHCGIGAAPYWCARIQWFLRSIASVMEFVYDVTATITHTTTSAEFLWRSYYFRTNFHCNRIYWTLLPL